MLRLVQLRKDIHSIKSCVSNLITCYKGRTTQCCCDKNLDRLRALIFFHNSNCAKVSLSIYESVTPPLG